MTANDKKVRAMPKGGRTGGAVFPRTYLTEALNYASKLVSKTHTGPQSQDIIFSAVVGSRTSAGRLRMSSLKQYGLLEGTVKSKFSASELAKKIIAAPPEEVTQLLRKAMLQPTIFRKLFETFHSDVFPKSKIKQRAAELNVHPSQTEACVKIYLEGMQLAKIISVDGDRIAHISESELSAPIAGSDADELIVEEKSSNEENTSPIVDSENLAGDIGKKDIEKKLVAAGDMPAPKAIFNVNVTLDSSLDIEKLRQHLELLKQFGAI